MKKTGVLFLVITLCVSLIYFQSRAAQAQATDSRSFGNPSTPRFQNLTLYVLYKNNTLDTNATWSRIEWVNVDRVGIHNQFGVGGFERDYGSIVWYPYSIIDNTTYDRPLWYGFIQFWAKAGGTWYKDYITKDVAKTPIFREVESCSGDVAGEWEIGWNGTIVYNTKSFPVYVGLRVRRSSPFMKIKTNVTTPLSLEDHAIEYDLYLNPYWKSYAEKNIEYVRVQFTNGTVIDYNITRAIDVTYDVPNMVFSFSFLNAYKNFTINTFDFGDVFSGNGTKLAKIEQVTLPNGATTYVLKVGATFGMLTAEKTFEIDPSFGKDTIGTQSAGLLGLDILFSKFTLSEAGNATSMSWYGHGVDGEPGRCCIYNTTGNKELIAYTPNVALSTTIQWWNFSFSSQVTLQAQDYYLGFQSNNDWHYFYVTGGAGKWFSPGSYILPSAWNGWANHTLSMSIFCNYTTLGVNNPPTISSFTSESTVYANKFFYLNCTVRDLDGSTQIVNATISLNGSITLKYDNTTNTFSEYQDSNNYCTLNTSNSLKTEINSTTFKLSWKLKLYWNYTPGSISITTAQVNDNQANGTNSQSNLFTFEPDIFIESASYTPTQPVVNQIFQLTGQLYYESTTIFPEDPSGITAYANSTENNTTTITNGAFYINVQAPSVEGWHYYLLYAVTVRGSTVQNQTVTVYIHPSGSPPPQPPPGGISWPLILPSQLNLFGSLVNLGAVAPGQEKQFALTIVWTGVNDITIKNVTVSDDSWVHILTTLPQSFMRQLGESNGTATITFSIQVPPDALPHAQQLTFVFTIESGTTLTQVSCGASFAVSAAPSPTQPVQDIVGLVLVLCVVVIVFGAITTRKKRSPV